MRATLESSAFANLIERLAVLRNRGSRAEFLRRHRCMLRPSVVEALAETVREKVRIDLGEALRSAEAALEIAKNIGEQGALARALRAKANALHFLGQNRAAAQLHERAVALFDAGGDAKETGRTLSASIQPLILLGEYGRAEAAGRRAQTIFHRCRDRLRLARLQINVGNIFYRQDRFSEALARYELAYKQLLPFKETEGIASALHNIAVCLISLNDFRRATAAYERARAFCEQHHMPLAVVQADYNVAFLHYLRGEYSLALAMLQDTQRHADRIPDDYHAALCRLDRAEIYLELNLTEEATLSAREAFVRFRKLEMGYEAARALTSFAVAASRQGQSGQALRLLRQARQMFVQEHNAVWPSVIDLYCAVILFTKRRYRRSRELCLKALKSFEASQLHQRSALCRLLLARLGLASGKMAAAGRECRRALSDIKPAEAPALAHQVYFAMGQIHEALHESAPAYKAYQRARERIEALRGNLHRDELKIAFAENRLEVYERLAAICLARPRRGAKDETFRYIEEAKSRNLREAVHRFGDRAPGPKVRRSNALRRAGNLREELNWCYHRIEIEQLSGGVRARARCGRLQQMARARERDLVKTIREMPEEDASAAGFYQPVNISLEGVRQALPQNAALLEFFRAGQQFMAAVVKPDACEIVPLAPVAQTEASVSLLRFQLSRFRLDVRHRDLARGPFLRVVQNHLRELYQRLVRPLRPLLESRRLVIVPHGALHYIPFHALFDGGQYLADTHTISYAPSASVFTLCSRRALRGAGRPLVLGVPDPRAPQILREVMAVSAILPRAELLVGKQATEEALRQKGSSSPCIHIATHAYFRQDSPLFSGIRLGTSYLTLFDLHHMTLPAQLITLSGCATGMSVVAGGDELLGLARGFLSAGARLLLLTLWDVNDATTTLFMKSFYRRIRDGQDPALAVRHAMLELRGEYAHPYYWAPFLLIGACS